MTRRVGLLAAALAATLLPAAAAAGAWTHIVRKRAVMPA
jgi:hypothetical protein